MNSRNNVCKVFAEISNRKIAMEVGDSAKGDSVEIVTQVFDKMFQSLYAPKCGLEVREYKTPEYTHHTALLGSPSRLFEIEFPFDPGSFMLAISSHNYFHVPSSKILRMQSAVKLFEIQLLQLSFHTKSPLFFHCTVICVVQHPSANFYKSFATFPGIYALLTSGRELWVLDSVRLVSTQFACQIFDTMFARERIVKTAGFVSSPGETFSYSVTFDTPCIVQFLSSLNKKLAHYIVNCDIARGLSSDFLVDLVGDPGIYSSASINGGVFFHGPSPFSVSPVTFDASACLLWLRNSANVCKMVKTAANGLTNEMHLDEVLTVAEVYYAICREARIDLTVINASVGFGGSCFQKYILHLIYICECNVVPQHRLLHLPFDPGLLRLTLVDFAILVPYDILDEEIFAKQHILFKFWSMKSAAKTFPTLVGSDLEDQVSVASSQGRIANMEFLLVQFGSRVYVATSIAALNAPVGLDRPSNTPFQVIEQTKMAQKKKELNSLQSFRGMTLIALTVGFLITEVQVLLPGGGFNLEMKVEKLRDIFKNKCSVLDYQLLRIQQANPLILIKDYPSKHLLAGFNIHGDRVDQIIEVLKVIEIGGSFFGHTYLHDELQTRLEVINRAKGCIDEFIRLCSYNYPYERAFFMDILRLPNDFSIHICSGVDTGQRLKMLEALATGKVWHIYCLSIKTDTSFVLDWKSEDERMLVQPSLSKIFLTSYVVSEALKLAAIVSLLVETVARIDLVMGKVLALHSIGERNELAKVDSQPVALASVEVHIATVSVPMPSFADLNLEDKVHFKDGRNVMNVTKMVDLFEKMANYIWDPGG